MPKAGMARKVHPSTHVDTIIRGLWLIFSARAGFFSAEHDSDKFMKCDQCSNELLASTLMVVSNFESNGRFAVSHCGCACRQTEQLDDTRDRTLVGAVRCVPLIAACCANSRNFPQLNRSNKNHDSHPFPCLCADVNIASIDAWGSHQQEGRYSGDSDCKF